MTRTVAVFAAFGAAIAFSAPAFASEDHNSTRSNTSQ